MSILLATAANSAASAAALGFSGIVLIFFCIFGAAVYFIPTIIAFKRDKANKIAILALNFFLGWSLIGWVVSLVWALSNEQAASPQQVIVYNTAPPPSSSQSSD